MLREQSDHVLLRQRVDDAALAPDDALGAPQRVDDGLFGRVDGRGEERVELVVGEAIALRPVEKAPALVTLATMYGEGAFHVRIRFSTARGPPPPSPPRAPPSGRSERDQKWLARPRRKPTPPPSAA